MSAITIELAERVEDECSCCGGRLIRLTRFVHADGAHAVYYAAFSPGSSERSVRVLLSVGAWGGWDGGRIPKKRVAFAFCIQTTGSEYQTTIVDAVESPWYGVKILGKILNRKNALAHPWIQEVFHIADHIVTDDRDVKEHLDGSGGGRPARRKTRKRN